MTGEAEIRAYVDATAAYYRVLWTTLPPSTATEDAAKDNENRSNFRTLLEKAEAYTGTVPLTELPATMTPELTQLLALIRVEDDAATTDRNERLDALNAVLTARNTARAAQTNISHDTQIRDRVSGAVRDELRGRLLNTATGLSTPPGEMGTLSDADKAVAADFGQVVMTANSGTITRPEATTILNDWIDTIATGNDARIKSDLATALGIPAEQLESFDLSNAANFQKALDAFRTRNQITAETGDLTASSTQTIRALRRQELDRTLVGRRAAEGAVRWSQETYASVSGWINGLFNPENPAQSGTTQTTAPASDNPLQGFMDWIGGLFGGQNGEGLNLGSIGGGILGVVGALFLGNVFPPQLRWLSWLLAPMAFLMGANIGKDWGRDNDGTPAPAGTSGRTPPSTQLNVERVNDPAFTALLERMQNAPSATTTTPPTTTTPTTTSLLVSEADHDEKTPLEFRTPTIAIGAAIQ